MEVDSRVSDAVQQWRCELTGGTERVVDVSLMSWTPLDATQQVNPWDWASQHVPPFPTAHEATLAWWLKLRRLVEAQPGAESTSQSSTEPRPRGRYNELFAQLTWNTAAALELLAGMEQERRWLHNHLAGSADKDFIPVADAANHFPRPPSRATIWRWVLNGVRGQKLATVLVGGRRFTSAAAIHQSFLERLNPAVAADKVDERRRRQAIAPNTSSRRAVS